MGSYSHGIYLQRRNINMNEIVTLGYKITTCKSALKEGNSIISKCVIKDPNPNRKSLTAVCGL